MTRLWHWLTDTHVVFTSPEVQRVFLRCDSCRRVFCHYWGFKEAHEGGRMGCPCGGIKARPCQIPEWQAAYYVLSRLLVRKLLLRKRYWDPRFPLRMSHAD